MFVNSSNWPDSGAKDSSTVVFCVVCSRLVAQVEYQTIENYSSNSYLISQFIYISARVRVNISRSCSAIKVGCVCTSQNNAAMSSQQHVAREMRLRLVVVIVINSS
jgi:hypothetical protein